MKRRYNHGDYVVIVRKEKDQHLTCGGVILNTITFSTSRRYYCSWFYQDQHGHGWFDENMIFQNIIEAENYIQNLEVPK